MAQVIEETGPALLGRNAAAQRLGVSVRCLDELLATKQLASVKIGKRRLVRPEAIEKLIARKERESR